MKATATIANGASLSGAVHVGGPDNGKALVAIQMPAAWTAASLTFQGSWDGTNFFDVYDAAGGEIVVATAASRWIVLDPADFASPVWMKVRSGTSGTAVNQGAARSIVLHLRLVD